MAYRYGVTPQQYADMLEAQAGVCAICKAPEDIRRRLNIDHNHDTDQIRSLLCTRCNVGLGSFRDNPSLLMKAAEYLDEWKEKT